jgi:hypothetical protein
LLRNEHVRVDIGDRQGRGDAGQFREFFHVSSLNLAPDRQFKGHVAKGGKLRKAASFETRQAR